MWVLVLIPGTPKEDWKGSQIQYHCPHFSGEVKEAQRTCQSCHSHINVKQLERRVPDTQYTNYLNYQETKQELSRCKMDQFRRGW